MTPNNCPKCGSYLSNQTFCHCGWKLSADIDTANAVTAGQTVQIAALAKTQAELLTDMAHALGRAGMLPITQLLAQFWDALDEPARREVAAALLQRGLQMIRNGAFDDQLHNSMQPLLTEPSIVAYLRSRNSIGARAIGRGLSLAIARILNEDTKAAGKQYGTANTEQRNSFKERIAETVQATVLEITKKYITDREALILRKTQKAIGDIDEISQNAVEQFTHEAIQRAISQAKKKKKKDEEDTT